MMTPQSILEYFKAEPFRPFRLHMASGRTFDVRHPVLVKILKSNLLIFKVTGDVSDFPDEWESVSLMLAESASHIDVPMR